MKHFFSAIALSLVLAPASVVVAGDKQEEQAKSAQASQKDLKQVEGTIVQHKFVNVFKDKKEMEQAQKSGKSENKMLVVLLKTDKGNDRLVVDLGQMDKLPDIKDGESKLQVEGKLINVGKKDLFVAKRAKLNGNKIDIQRKSS